MGEPICCHVPGVPLASGALHNSTRFKCEPPASETVYEIVTWFPAVIDLGCTSNAFTVGGVVSAAFTANSHAVVTPLPVLPLNACMFQR